MGLVVLLLDNAIETLELRLRGPIAIVFTTRNL